MSPAASEFDSFNVALIVADDALRSAMRMLLSVSGLSVTEYRTVTEYLVSPVNTRHCLVMDCQFPDMSRRRLSEEILKLDKSMPIVVVTAYPEDFDCVRALRGNMHIVPKPFAGNHLVDTVTHAARAAFSAEHLEGDLQSTGS